MKNFVSENMLKEAKSFLCWNVFDTLSVQLVPLQEAVAYYYPPENKFHSIIVFYDCRQKDHSRALFLLFHEAGHIRQWLETKQQRDNNKFLEFLNLDNGADKQQFEHQAWQKGRELLKLFLRQSNIDSNILMQKYQDYSDKCVESYA